MGQQHIQAILQLGQGMLASQPAGQRAQARELCGGQAVEAQPDEVIGLLGP